MSPFPVLAPQKSRLGVLLDHFAAIDDPRDVRRIAHPLAEVLLLVVCATMADCDDHDHIAARGATRLDFLCPPALRARHPRRTLADHPDEPRQPRPVLGRPHRLGARDLARTPRVRRHLWQGLARCTVYRRGRGPDALPGCPPRSRRTACLRRKPITAANSSKIRPRSKRLARAQRPATAATNLSRVVMPIRPILALADEHRLKANQVRQPRWRPYGGTRVVAFPTDAGDAPRALHCLQQDLGTIISFRVLLGCHAEFLILIARSKLDGP